MKPEIQLIGDLTNYMVQCAPHVKARSAYKLLHRSHDTIVELCLEIERLEKRRVAIG